MKKVLTIIAFVLTLFILAGCNAKSDVKISIKNVTPAASRKQIVENRCSGVTYV